MGDGREVQEGDDICIPMLIHLDVWQKATQYCREIILQLEINTLKKREMMFVYSQDVPGTQCSNV